jgi:hypothetical protein
MHLRNVKFGLSDNDLVSVLNTYNFKEKTPKKLGFYHGTSVGAGSPIVRTGVTEDEEENVKKKDMVKA